MNKTPALRSALILNQDKDWDRSCQIPLEPTRWGGITVLEKSILKKHTLIKTYLEKNDYQGSYFSTQTLKHRIAETSLELTKKDKLIIGLAKNFLKNKDVSTAYLLNSLIFSPKDYKTIEEQVHLRLSTSMLGPNPIVVKPIIDSVLAHVSNKRNQEVKILDPFAGNGSLGLILAEELNKKGIKRYTIFNNDLSSHIHQQGSHILAKLIPTRLKAVNKHLHWVHGNGLILDHIPNHSLDIIVTLRALHEHPQSKVEQFFRTCLTKVKSGGIIIIDDVTRESTILNRAKKLLPFLGQMTAYRLLTEGKLKQIHTNQLVERIMIGDPYLAQAGIQSYVSGFLLSELMKISQNAGFKPPQIKGFYDYHSPFPLGSMQLRLTV
jgi:SAM-dependent methyltransferase